ncbi:MAG: hypothetical protein P4M07_23870 [Xanthobacteraceae bacterium]|nr:hypothetical protein [Xanthobacteraceae bacterium]
MKKFTVIAAGASMVLFAWQASATELTFDDIGMPGTVNPTD